MPTHRPDGAPIGAPLRRPVNGRTPAPPPPVAVAAPPAPADHVTATRDEIMSEMGDIAGHLKERNLTNAEADRYVELEGQLAAVNRSQQIRSRHDAYDTPAPGQPALLGGGQAGGPTAFTERGFYNGPRSLTPDPAGMVELYDAWREKRPARVQARSEEH